jgi:predicted acetyltransferase
MITVRHCREADKEHNKSRRQYAHTYHHHNVICVADAWLDLPLENQLAIVAHEVGHILVNSTDHTEQEADKTANKFFKIRIRYENTNRYGNRLQYVSFKDAEKVYLWLVKNVKLDNIKLVVV